MASMDQGERADRFGRTPVRPVAVVTALAIAGLLVLGPGEDPAEAYRLYDNGAFDYIVPSRDAIRWSAAAWGPGRTLEWEIEDGPDLPRLLDHFPEDFGTRYVGPALSAWSDVPTADISWRLTGLRDPSGERRFGNGRNQVFFDPGSGVSGAAAWWIRNRELEVWEITECDVGVNEWFVDRLEAGDTDPETVKDWVFGSLVQDFGHCLGLGQAARFPQSWGLRTSATSDSGAYPGTAVWSPLPAMGWGVNPAEDDRVGASLLRPRASWLSSTGSVAGRLESGGVPVAYGHVYALRVGADGLRDPVGGFANAGGRFLIEGLPPGEYVLWAHPIRFWFRHRPLIEDGADVEVMDAVLAHPVRVEAGRTAEGITIPMRQGRE